MTPNPEGRYICERCTTRWDEAIDCPRCPEEPLLDLLDEDVLLLLKSLDDIRWRKRAGLLLFVAIVLCSPLLLIVPWLRELGIMAYGGVSVTVAGALIQVFPPKKKTPDLGQLH